MEEEGDRGRNLYRDKEAFLVGGGRENQNEGRKEGKIGGGGRGLSKLKFHFIQQVTL